jgi:very-short-patch-repair endonuclease
MIPHPSSACRHLLPQGEKGDGDAASQPCGQSTAPPLPSPLAGEGARRADEGEAKNTRLRGSARHLRTDGTEAEQMVWAMLRDRRFDDHKFRRQVPIEGFIADFICYSARLIIELDGSQHADSTRDARRDEILRANDFRTLRIWNDDVFLNRDGVMEAIWSALQENPSSACRHLLPQGEKGDRTAASQPCGQSTAPPLPSPLAGEGARRADEGAAKNPHVSTGEGEGQ